MVGMVGFIVAYGCYIWFGLRDEPEKHNGYSSEFVLADNQTDIIVADSEVEHDIKIGRAHV